MHRLLHARAHHTMPLTTLDSRSHIIERTINKSYDVEYSGYTTLYYLKTEPTQFLELLGFDNNNTIINNTNSFLVDANFTNVHNILQYDKVSNNVFSRMHNLVAMKDIIEVTTTIEEPMFLLANPFSGRNSGHDLSILFNRIDIYLQRKYTMPVVITDSMLEFPFTYEICKILLPNTTFHILSKDTATIFKHLIVTKNVIFDINKHKYLHQQIIDHFITTTENIDNYKNKKICLIKNTAVNKNIVTVSTAFKSISLMNKLRDNYNYIILNPETASAREIVLYLYYASKILVSFGGIMYTNCIFFNNSAKLYYIVQHRFTYPPYFNKEKYTYVYMPYDLDTVESSFLQQINEN